LLAKVTGKDKPDFSKHPSTAKKAPRPEFAKTASPATPPSKTTAPPKKLPSPSDKKTQKATPKGKAAFVPPKSTPVSSQKKSFLSTPTDDFLVPDGVEVTTVDLDGTKHVTIFDEEEAPTPETKATPPSKRECFLFHFVILFSEETTSDLRAAEA